MRRIRSLMPLALAAVAFGQTAAGPVPDKEAPESAEHKYARQQFELVDKLGHDLALQSNAQGERMMKDCGPRETRILFSDLGQDYMVPPRPTFKHETASEKKQALAEYEARKAACIADYKERPVMIAELDANIQKSKDLKFKLDHADECAAIYRKTIDEKAADITTREAEQIKACQSVDLYPPGK